LRFIFVPMYAKAELIKERLKNNHFITHLGLYANEIEEGMCCLYIDVEEHHQQHHGFLHGGVTATLCDVATGIAAYTVVPDHKNVVTADLNVSYLAPSVGKKVKAVGTVTKAGKTLIYCDCKIYDLLENGEEKLIGTGRSIMVAIDTPTK
jgi:uncharacterized protein (TIGR00369 family)